MTLCIEKMIMRELRMPLVSPFRISSGVENERRIFLLELFDKDGTVTWSESVAGAAPNYSSETIDTVWLVMRAYIAPRVLGIDFDHPRDVNAALERNFRGHHMARAAVEMGAWGLLAEKQQISLAKLLGGVRPTIQTGISIGIQDSPAQLVEKARIAFDEGYPKIKAKIQPGADLEYLGALREALGDDASIMGDANNAYSMELHREQLLEMDKFNLLMLEQPLAWDDVVRHAELQRLLKTPVCLDESIINRERAQDMITLKSGKIINIKPGRVGGFTESLAIHDLAQTNDIPVWCGGMLESGVGRAYNVALASLPNFTLPGDLSPSARYWKQDIVDPEWTMDGSGNVTVPMDLPGLGVRVDRKRIDELCVRAEVLEAD